jgi:hypothetical protein
VSRARPRIPDLSTLREDTRHEQFFFDDRTIERLVELLGTARDPLLVCLPSIAVALAQRGSPARLLDRDVRFHKLPRAQDFDLYQPDYIEGRHDFLLCDPPFANVDLSTLRRTLDLLVSTAMEPAAHPAVGLAYISSRESALKQAFAPYDFRPVGPPLGYRSVARSTQDRIRLYLSTGARTACGLP